jgi:hypothetical protein
MRKNYCISILVLAVFLSSCSTVKITSDQAKDADFSLYKTFSFLGWQENSDQIINDMDMKRLHDAFKSEFKIRDLELVNEGGDMAVSLYLVVSKETSTTAYTNYHGGYGGRYNRYGYGWGGGSATTTYSESDYLKGTLVMDVFDEKSGQQVWQGIATSTINEKPEKRDTSIPKGISALMKEFPVAPKEGN